MPLSAKMPHDASTVFAQRKASTKSSKICNLTNAMNTIYQVSFFAPVDGRSDYYFSSIAAIYTRFTPAQIGISLSGLWGFHLSLAHPKTTRQCRISKHAVISKPQRNKRNR